MRDSNGQTAPPAEQASEDFGFGATMVAQRGARLINSNGSFNVLRTRNSVFDVFSYGTLLRVSWPRFFALALAAFAALNLLFALGFLLCGPRALLSAGPSLGVNRVWRAIFFSVHTFSTVGYGNIIPVGLPANLLVTAEAITALLNAALVTGLVFARFSKPDVRIQFSARAVVRLQERPALLVRLRNLTRNEVLDVEATLIVWFRDPTDGTKRHFRILPLERSRISYLPLSWTVAHFITPESPFFGLSAEQFRQTFGEAIVQLRGMDQNGAQAIYARTSYITEEVDWGSRFADQYTHDQATGILGIDPERFHTTLQE